jgi:hypothetical protein
MADPVTPTQGPGVAQVAGAPTSRLSFLSVPPPLEGVKQIAGEVIQVDGKQVTLKTADGVLSFETDAALQVGQKVLLRLQNIVSQAASQNLAQILVMTERGEVKPAPLQTQATQTPAKQPQILPQDAVTFAPLTATQTEEVLQNIRTLPALMTLLPQKLSEAGRDLLIKQFMNLSPTQPLPPPLQEAMAKIQELLSTVKPAAVQAQSIVPTISPAIEPKLLEQILTVLQGASLPQAQTKSVQPQFVTSLPPGTPITAETLQQILQAIPQAAQNPQPSKIALNVPVQTQPNSQQPVPLLAVYIVPSPQNGAATVLMTLPDGQQGIGFVKVPEAAMRSMLPGTVMVMSMPQGEVAKLPAMMMPSIGLPVAMLTPTLAPFNPGIGKEWEALQSLWRDVQTGTFPLPDVAGALRAAMPNPVLPQQFTPAVLFFMAILKQNLPLPWASEKALAGLPAEKAALLSQLSRDLGAIRAAMADQGPVDAWRPMPMPMQNGDQLMRMQWFYRHQYDDPREGAADTPEERRKRRKTRFLLDVPQTGLGDIQIDGLVQPQQLDVILRTEDNLQAHQRLAIGERFQKALDITGFAGAVTFQPGPQHYVRV